MDARCDLTSLLNQTARDNVVPMRPPGTGSSPSFALMLNWLAAATVCRSRNVTRGGVVPLCSIFSARHTCMHYFIGVCVASFLLQLAPAAEAPDCAGLPGRLRRLQRQSRDTLASALSNRRNSTARDGKYSLCGIVPSPDEPLAICTPINFDYEKARWIRFMDRLVEGTSDLSAEMPTRDEVVIFRDTDEKVVVKESVAKYPHRR